MFYFLIVKCIQLTFHFSQSLINLLITGKAVTNVWDNDKDVSGLSKYNSFLQCPLALHQWFPSNSKLCDFHRAFFYLKLHPP